MALMLMATLIYLFFWGYFRHLNMRREEGKEDYKVQGMTDEEIDELGDESPRFRYTY